MEEARPNLQDPHPSRDRGSGDPRAFIPCIESRRKTHTLSLYIFLWRIMMQMPPRCPSFRHERSSAANHSPKGETMKKLRMDLDALNVESFTLGDRPDLRGTVRGHLTFTDPRVCPASQNWNCSVGACTRYSPYCAPPTAD
jgi:hypothetical protein